MGVYKGFVYVCFILWVNLWPFSLVGRKQGSIGPRGEGGSIPRGSQLYGSEGDPQPLGWGVREAESWALSPGP